MVKIEKIELNKIVELIKNKKVELENVEKEIAQGNYESEWDIPFNLKWKPFNLKSEIKELENNPEQQIKRWKLITDLEKSDWRELVDKNAKSIKKLLNSETVKIIGKEKSQYIYEKAAEKKEKQRAFWRNKDKNSPIGKWVRDGVKIVK
jgi:hypothetical protein